MTADQPATIGRRAALALVAGVGIGVAVAPVTGRAGTANAAPAGRTVAIGVRAGESVRLTVR